MINNHYLKWKLASPAQKVKFAWFFSLLLIGLNISGIFFNFWDCELIDIIPALTMLGFAIGMKYKHSRFCAIALLIQWALLKLCCVCAYPGKMLGDLIWGVMGGMIYYRAIKAIYLLKKANNTSTLISE